MLHRIVARDGNRYVFKGDNNNFVDFEHPAQSQLIGALWLHLPGAGAKLQALRSPALVGVLVAMGTLLLAGAAVTQNRRRRRRERRTGEGSTAAPKPISQYAAGPMLGVLAFGLLAMLPFLALALLAFTRPTSALLPADVPYRQSGALSYSADATPGPAYSGNHAATGDPLFTHVLSSVDLRYLYHFHTSAQHALAGSAALYATVSSTSGWKTTLPLGAANAFRGSSALADGELDLPAVLALMRRVEATTAVGGSYTLTIEPRVNVGGTVGGGAAAHHLLTRDQVLAQPARGSTDRLRGRRAQRRPAVRRELLDESVRAVHCRLGQRQGQPAAVPVVQADAAVRGNRALDRPHRHRPHLRNHAAAGRVHTAAARP